MNLQDFKDNLLQLSSLLHRVREAHAKGVCIHCKQPPTFSTEAGRREYQISSMCEPCFDAMFAEEEE